MVASQAFAARRCATYDEAPMLSPQIGRQPCAFVLEVDVGLGLQIGAAFTVSVSPSGDSDTVQASMATSTGHGEARMGAQPDGRHLPMGELRKAAQLVRAMATYNCQRGSAPVSVSSDERLHLGAPVAS